MAVPPPPFLEEVTKPLDNSVTEDVEGLYDYSAAIRACLAGAREGKEAFPGYLCLQGS